MEEAWGRGLSHGWSCDVPKALLLRGAGFPALGDTGLLEVGGGFCLGDHLWTLSA